MTIYFPNRVCHHRLEIQDLNKLYDVTALFESDPALERQVTAIDISDKDGDSLSDVAGGRESEPFGNISRLVASIIDAVQESDGLESFRWVGEPTEPKATREFCFWEHLWSTAKTLKSLDLCFFTHELSRMLQYQGDETIAAPPKFPALRSLRIDASGGHGDDASIIDKMLRNAPGLEELILVFPGCDLENCQIKGITWQYTFPALKRLSISTYYDTDNTALLTFLASHPTITALGWEVDADEPLVLPSAYLPNLRVLNSESIDVICDPEAVSDATSISPRPLVHIRLGSRSRHNLLKVGTFAKTLKCLDIDISIEHWRPDSDSDEEVKDEADKPPSARDILKDILPQLRDLQELGIDLETGNIYFKDGEDGDFVNPPPMDVNDLKSILNTLPPSTGIRALRVSDSRGLDLPGELLNRFPDIPPSLEYLKWITRAKTILYRLERGEGNVRAVECEPQRVARKGDEDLWEERRVLDYGQPKPLIYHLKK